MKFQHKINEMKKIILVLPVSLCLFACSLANKTDANAGQSTDSVNVILPEPPAPQLSLTQLLTKADAEKIMGEAAHQQDSAFTAKEGYSSFLSSFIADKKDAKSNNTGAIYFFGEEYPKVSDAQQKYSSIKKANENHEGIKTRNDLGDEAYFHSDGTNFYFIMVRKGKRVFNLKVNKLTTSTSLDEFNRVAAQIAGGL
jgi:hypothetical protein